MEFLMELFIEIVLESAMEVSGNRRYSKAARILAYLFLFLAAIATLTVMVAIIFLSIKVWQNDEPLAAALLFAIDLVLIIMGCRKLLECRQEIKNRIAQRKQRL